jgi:hypothetical protein
MAHLISGIDSANFAPTAFHKWPAPTISSRRSTDIQPVFFRSPASAIAALALVFCFHILSQQPKISFS